MSDRPIIFSAPMVRALLEGRKTQTRRLAWRPLPPLPPGQVDAREECPAPWQYVQPGDRLWVREAWATHWANDNLAPSAISPMHWSVRYLADDHVRRARDGSLAAVGQCKKGRPSIHMPRWASRITLHVEAVRVERLQDISEADARAEGVLYVPGHGEIKSADLQEGFANYLNCRMGFEVLWNSLHGPGAWDANPEVVALTFTVAQRNIDHVAAAVERAAKEGGDE
jgi:hypothetical protein